MMGPSLLLLLVAGTFLLGMSIGSRHPREGRVPEPCCGRCRYPVQGTPTFICPECGTDLRDAGILTPARDGRPSGAS